MRAAPKSQRTDGAVRVYRCVLADVEDALANVRASLGRHGWTVLDDGVRIEPCRDYVFVSAWAIPPPKEVVA